MDASQVPGGDQPTLEFYATTAEIYTASGKNGTNRFLNDFMKRIPAGAHILELGCGGGRDAEAMIAAGFNLTPTDGTPEIAAQAEKRLGRPVRVMRFDQLESTAEFDAVWASASLLHVPRADLPQILARIHAALRPGGIHFASYKAGGQEGRDSHGRYFNYLSREELLSAYETSASWTILNVTEYVGGGYENRQGPWVAITVKKPA